MDRDKTRARAPGLLALCLLLPGCEQVLGPVDPGAPVAGDAADAPDGGDAPDAAAPDLPAGPDLAEPYPQDPEEPLPPLTPLGAWVSISSPGWGMRFLGPADLRLQAGALDPSSGSFAMPRKVDFYLNDGRGERLVGTAPRDAGRPGLYFVRATGVAAGRYRVKAVSTNEDGTRATSQEVLIIVEDTAGRAARQLDADVVLSGASDLVIEGAPGAPLLLEGRGRSIRSAPGWSGRLVLRNVEARDLGSAAAPAIDVSPSGAGGVTIEDSVFDASGQVRLGVSGAATVAVRRSEFRANGRVAVLDQPSNSEPAFHALGDSTGQKVFQGNRLGLSWAQFEGGGPWLIGGDSDAEANMVWAPRGGLHVRSAHDVVLRGNYSHCNCGPGLSQCLNFELSDNRNVLIEHNVIRSSAWPLRGSSGEVRYNLILDSAHSWLQAPQSGTKIHHNIFGQVSGPVSYAPEQGVFIFGSSGVELYNNTFDGGGDAIGWYGNVLSVAPGATVGSLRSNLFVRFSSQLNSPIVGGNFLERLGTPGPARLGSADYNHFYCPGRPGKVAYGVSVSGLAPGAAGFAQHDRGLGGEGQDPRLAQAAPLPYPIRQGALWARRGKLSQVLAAYRGYYAPAAGSPLVDQGDPRDGAGNDVGAVGAGAAHAQDRFGRFGAP